MKIVGRLHCKTKSNRKLLDACISQILCFYKTEPIKMIFLKVLAPFVVISWKEKRKAILILQTFFGLFYNVQIKELLALATHKLVVGSGD